MTTSTRSVLLISICAAATLPLFSAAQSQPASTCPARYEMVVGLCIHAATGDVVSAVAPAVTPTRATAQCKAGYEFMTNALCVHGKWGDVVYADVVPGTQTAQK